MTADLGFSAAGPAQVSAPTPTGAATPVSTAASTDELAAAPTLGADAGSNDRPQTWPDEKAVNQRRLALDRPTSTERVALALSGGGIRSATFSLGVVQALAAAKLDTTEPRTFTNSMLSCIDYLSTVSGGGYLGGFLCSLFLPGRLRVVQREDGNRRAPLHQLVSFVRSRLRPAGNKSAAQTDKSAEQAAAHAAPDSSTQPVKVESAKEQQLEAAEDAMLVLSSGPPGRMRASDEFTEEKILNAPLRWLRENGRYMLPSGSGDAVYALALGLRNWISVHCVIGTVLVSGLALLILLRTWVATDDTYRDWEKALLEAACKAYQPDGGGIDRIWWSPLMVLCLVPIASVGLVLGTAFWLVQERDDGCSRVLNTSVAGVALVSVALIGIAALQWPDHFGRLLHRELFWPVEQPQRGEVVRMGLIVAVGTVSLLSLPVYFVVSLLTASASRQRVALTRGLAVTLQTSAVIAGLGVIDTAGQSLYLAAFHTDSTGTTAATVASPAALAGALAWLVQRLAKSGGGKWPDFLRKLPLMSLAGLAGIVIFVLVGALWATLVHLMIWGGGTPSPDRLLHYDSQAAILGWVVGVSLAVALVTGFFPGFINLSSLQPFYGSRLTRAYLGASNGRRFLEENRAKRSAAEPMAGDEVRLDNYVDPKSGDIRTLAPLHIINVCVNKTVDPAEQLVQRDRKGLPLAVLPCGLALDCDQIKAFPAPPELAGGQTWRERLARLFQTSVNRPLTVGQWIGTSGAAFSTGIGRETTLGMSLLMGAANVRLGTWWSTGSGRAGTPGTRVGRAMPEWLRKAAGLPFRTQRYLSYELRASFHGTNRTWQYLSDGGHFENTALYELLRTHRRVGTIFASDNGADPEYRFDDLANLIRLARIDLQVRIEVADPPPTGALAGLFGRPEDFRSIALRRAGAAAAPSTATPAAVSAPAQGPIEPVAMLLYAWKEENLSSAGIVAEQTGIEGKTAAPAPRVTQIVLIKPLVTGKVPADVRQYAAAHPSFPQEPTADQFFDEAQWESYRALGDHQAGRIFQPDVLSALKEARLAWKKS